MSLKARVKQFLFDKLQGQTLPKNVPADEKTPVNVVEEKTYNPLQLMVADVLELTFEAPGIYRIEKIMTAITEHGGQEFWSVRYFLRDTPEVEDREPLALEYIQAAASAGTDETYVWHIIDQFEYEEEVKELLEEKTFVISEESDDGNEEIEKEYEKISHLISDVNIIASDRQTYTTTMETWKYVLEEESETWYLAVELDRSNGWLTLYEGRGGGHDEFEIYQLSAEES